MDIRTWSFVLIGAVLLILILDTIRRIVRKIAIKRLERAVEEAEKWKFLHPHRGPLEHLLLVYHLDQAYKWNAWANRMSGYPARHGENALERALMTPYDPDKPKKPGENS